MDSSSGRGGISFVMYETASVTLQIVSVIFNVAIICTLSKKSLIRCPSNKFVFSLCLSHLFVSTSTLLISAIQFFGITKTEDSVLTFTDTPSTIPPSDSEHPQNYLTFVLSNLLLYLTLTAIIGTSINVALISVERYITIAHPMKYKSIVTPVRCTAIILISWMLPVIAIPLPLLFSGNQTVLHGSFAVPSGRLGLYYAIVFSCVTFVVLSVMILCYLHIFMIAKAKCQKVQIGHFTSPVSSISSDWPSTAYSSQAEGQLPSHSPCPPVKDIQRLSSSNNLLQYVLMTNLGRHTHTQPPLRVPLNDLSAERKIHVLSHHHQQKSTTTTIGGADVQTRLAHVHAHHGHHGVQSLCPLPVPAVQPRRWKTFLKQNYNSPRKTVSTIVILISSLVLTQLPLSVALFFPTQGFSLFYFSFKHIFPFASLTNPVLYGFLNRTIRVHLLKFLRVRRRPRGFPVNPRNITNGRKASVSSADSNQFLKREISVANEEDKISLKNLGCSQLYNNRIENIESVFPNPINQLHHRSNKEEETLRSSTNENISSDCQTNEDLKTFTQCESGEIPSTETDAEELQVEESENLQATNFPRKPSQDSGVDVAFTDDEEEDNKAENEESKGHGRHGSTE